MDAQQVQQEILRDRPFSNYCTITSIHSLAQNDIADSGGAFFIDTNKGRFKLRVCVDASQAKIIEETVRNPKLSHILPKFYGREGRYLLFEALRGFKNLREEDLLQNMRKIGRIYAEIHLYGAEGKHDQETFFTRCLDAIHDAKIIDDTLYITTKNAFEQSLKTVGNAISMELIDINEENFMMNDQGEFYLVDEECITHTAKGFGIGKLLRRLDIREWKEFVAGYEEVTHDSRHITSPAILHHINLLNLVYTINTKREKGENERMMKALGELRVMLR